MADWCNTHVLIHDVLVWRQWVIDSCSCVKIYFCRFTCVFLYAYIWKCRLWCEVAIVL